MTHNRKGSVLLLTLFLVVLAAFAMSRFIERAHGEIISEALYAERDRLRVEAYSALESTIATLYNVVRLDEQLYSPEQGWADPLWLAGVRLPDDLEVEVEFEDEMGKISLPGAGRDRLLRLFEHLGFDAIDSQELTEALQGWMSRQEAEQGFAAHHSDYERAELPYEPPYRPLRSFQELAAIAGFRDAFFDGQGVPNERFHRLTSLVSLYQFETINANTASPAVLQIWSDVGEQEADNIGTHRQRVPGTKPYFESVEEAEQQLGIPLGDGYGVATHCLRINITVSHGTSDFVLSAVVAPSNASGSLRPEPEPELDEDRGAQRRRRSQQRESQQRESQERDSQGDVSYPYTFLEIRENEAIL